MYNDKIMNKLLSYSLHTFFAFFFLINVLPVQAQPSQMQIKVDYSNSLKPVAVLTNTGSEACRVIGIPLGTITISKVVQNGATVEAIPIKIGIDDTMESMLVANLETLQPNESIRIPLDVFPYEDSHAIQSVTWSPEAGAFAMIFPFKSDTPYEVSFTYSAPITSAGDIPLCESASTGTTTETSSVLQSVNSYAVFIIVGIATLGILILIFLFLRSKKINKKIAKKALILLIFFSVAIAMVQPAKAEYGVPESASGAFSDCLAEFERYPDITGPVLDALDGGRIEIITNDRGVNYATDWPDGSFRIHWDPESEYNYPNGGSPVPSTPCDRLFHEMYHVYEMMNGTFTRDDCAGSGIETKEVNATRAQNRLREAMGLPPRTHYGDTPLPEGDCSEPPADRTPPCTGGSCGSSTGDPHLRTFDNLNYSFMAVGEFTLVRNVEGTFEVQTRQEPWYDSRSVSINTSVAMKMGENRIELQIVDRKPVILLNGKVQKLEDRELDGGTITIDGTNTILIVWPDGTRVHTTLIARGLHVVVDPAPDQKGKLEGLLGNYSGNSSDDLKVRGTDDTIEPEFEKLYPRFADSWRISKETSLFTYPEGKTTESYTDRTFPDERVTAETVPNRAAAEAICRELGVKDLVLLNNCIVDVGSTGLAEFALASRLSQQVIDVKTVDFGGKKYPIRINNPGDEATIEFEGTAGSMVFIDLTETDLPNQCGNFRLLFNGSTVRNGCIINGRGDIDRALLEETGTYTIALRSTEEVTGTAVIQIISIQDQIGTITPDGESVVASTNKPGQQSRFSFEGKAGQFVYVHIPTTTLPSQCGGIEINGPDRTIGTGCIINGQGKIDRTELPADGTYTIVIDPSDTNSGTATVQLVLAQDATLEVTPDGGPVSATLTKPGSIAEFTFQGRAGQRVFIDIPASTLPSQCGGIGLIGPNDRSVDSACILNGTGSFAEEGIVLPETGTYTIRIDPSDDTIGEVTVQVRE